MYLLKVLINKCKEMVLKMKIDISKKTNKKVSKQKWVNYHYKMKTTSKQKIKVELNQFKLKFNLKIYD